MSQSISDPNGCINSLEINALRKLELDARVSKMNNLTKRQADNGNSPLAKMYSQHLIARENVFLKLSNIFCTRAQSDVFALHSNVSLNPFLIQVGVLIP